MSVADDLLGDRAQQDTFDTGSSVTAHDDQINASFIVEHRERLRPGIADARAHRHLRVGLVLQAFDRRLQRRRRALIEIGGEVRNRGLAGVRDWNFEDVEQRDHTVGLDQVDRDVDSMMSAVR